MDLITKYIKLFCKIKKVTTQNNCVLPFEFCIKKTFKMYLRRIKINIEKQFQEIEIKNDIYGFQIQPNTKFLSGLEVSQINDLEKLFGFKFPFVYKEMLHLFNGFDTPEISIYPDDLGQIEYANFFYQYPRDFGIDIWLKKDIKEFKEEIKLVLSENNFDTTQIEGFIPIYSHRALVVFKDKTLSPVISIYGADVILFGNDLLDYLKKEFLNIH